MRNYKPLPTANKAWGFWGTCEHAGYNTQMAWDAMSEHIVERYDLTPEHTRDLLDSKFGRHLVDELSFIEGGPVSKKAIVDHITKLLKDRKWCLYFGDAINATGTSPEYNAAREAQADRYYTAKEKLTKQLTSMANRVHAPVNAGRKMPKDLTSQDIKTIKTAYAKIIEASDILEIIDV
ncbi:MAG: hypothetical protein AB7S81_00110 [Bdellovibrionales bacterium]